MQITQKMWQRSNNYILIALAVSVNLGSALVSISKALVLISLFFYLLCYKPWQRKHQWQKMPWTIWVLILSISWFLITYCWADVEPKIFITSINRHARLLLIFVIFGIIASRESIYRILQFIIVGHLFVLLLSFLMWMGVYIPLVQDKQPYEYAVPFTSSLEQPVMSALVLAVIWFFRKRWIGIYGATIVYAAASMCVINVFFIMMGRTGYLLMILLITLIAFFELPKKTKWASIFIPLILGYAVFNLSPRLQSRTIEIESGIKQYQTGSVEKSEGQRLDYWHRSFLSIQEHPIIGSGVGSWRNKYQEYGGKESNPPTNPHNQFLLWWVEAGGIGFVLLVAFFAALFRDANKLAQQESKALICITTLAIVMSLFNCPFYGIGMGEFFMLLFACLLATGKYAEANKIPLKVQAS